MGGGEELLTGPAPTHQDTRDPGGSGSQNEPASLFSRWFKHRRKDLPSRGAQSRTHDTFLSVEDLYSAIGHPRTHSGFRCEVVPGNNRHGTGHHALNDGNGSQNSYAVGRVKPDTPKSMPRRPAGNNMIHMPLPVAFQREGGHVSGVEVPIIQGIENLRLASGVAFRADPDILILRRFNVEARTCSVRVAAG